MLELLCHWWSCANGMLDGTWQGCSTSGWSVSEMVVAGTDLLFSWTTVPLEEYSNHEIHKGPDSLDTTDNAFFSCVYKKHLSSFHYWLAVLIGWITTALSWCHREVHLCSSFTCKTQNLGHMTLLLLFFFLGLNPSRWTHDHWVRALRHYLVNLWSSRKIFST